MESEKGGIEFEYLHGEAYNLLQDIESERFKLIMTSPPYNIGKEYESKESIQEYLATQKDIISELVRVLHPEGSVCWQVGSYIKNGEVFPLDIFYYEIFKDLGLFLRNRIIWHFGHGLHASKRFSGRYETILWFTKGENYTFNLDPVRVPSKYPGKRHYKGPNKGKLSGNPLGKNPSDIWSIILQDWENELWEIPNVRANHVEKTEHPCQYPIELVERCILALTNQGDWVIDPFAGVGSTMLGALRQMRNVIGIEMHQKYIDIGMERIKLFQNGSLKVRPIERRIYDHRKSNLSLFPEEFTDKVKQNE